MLLAGSAHAFNRTHCGLANRVIAPFTRLGHPVVVFAADENGDDDAMVPALERIRKDYPNVDFVVAPPAAASQKDLHDRCVESVERRFRRMGVGPGSIYAESHQTHAVARARWEERNLDDSRLDDDGSGHSSTPVAARDRGYPAETRAPTRTTPSARIAGASCTTCAGSRRVSARTTRAYGERKRRR